MFDSSLFWFRFEIRVVLLCVLRYVAFLLTRERFEILRSAMIFEWCDIGCSWIISLTRRLSRTLHGNSQAMILSMNNRVNFDAQRLWLVAVHEWNRIYGIAMSGRLLLCPHEWKGVLQRWWCFVWSEILIMESIKHSAYFGSIASRWYPPFIFYWGAMLTTWRSVTMP